MCIEKNQYNCRAHKNREIINYARQLGSNDEKLLRLIIEKTRQSIYEQPITNLNKTPLPELEKNWVPGTISYKISRWQRFKWWLGFDKIK